MQYFIRSLILKLKGRKWKWKHFTNLSDWGVRGKLLGKVGKKRVRFFFRMQLWRTKGFRKKMSVKIVIVQHLSEHFCVQCMFRIFCVHSKILRSSFAFSAQMIWSFLFIKWKSYALIRSNIYMHIYWLITYVGID